jgi:hypothetical protein
VTEIKELLEAYVPVRSDQQPDWAEVLSRAGLDGAERPRTRRRLLVPVLVVLGLIVTGVAVAAALDGLPWWETASPPVHPQVVDYELNPRFQGDGDLPHPNRKHARTVATSNGAALVAAPVGKEGQCLLLFMPESAAPATGRSCIFRVDKSAPSVESGAFDELTSYARPQSEIISAMGPRWVLYGRVADPRAATLDLSAAAGFTFRVALHPGGFFLVDVPKADWSLLSNRVGEGKILDQNGGTLRTGCVAWGPAPGALGAGQKGSLWGDDVPRCRPVRMPWSVEVEDATKLVGITVDNPLPGNAPGDSIAVWRAAQKDGTVCVFQALASPRPHTAPSPSDRFSGPDAYRNMPNDVVCDEDAEPLDKTPPGKPVDIAIGGGSTDDKWQYELLGHVDPHSSVQRLELTSAKGPVPLAFENHWFVAQFPAGGVLHELPLGGPYVLVGLDAEGHEVARIDLQKALNRAEQQGCGGLNGMYACADRESG